MGRNTYNSLPKYLPNKILYYINEQMFKDNEICSYI